MHAHLKRRFAAGIALSVLGVAGGGCGDGSDAPPVATSAPQMLADRATAFFTTRSAESEAALRVLLRSFAAVADDLARDVSNARLVDELREPAQKLALLGQAGLAGLDLLEQSARGEPIDTSTLQALLDEAHALPWLVGANTGFLPGLDVFLAGRAAVQADVFGAFFTGLSAELTSGR